MSNRNSLATFLFSSVLPQARKLKRNGASASRISREVDKFLRIAVEELIATAEIDVGHRVPRLPFDRVRGGGNCN